MLMDPLTYGAVSMGVSRSLVAQSVINLGMMDVDADRRFECTLPNHVVHPKKV